MNKHKYYEDVKKLKEFYYAIYTGKNQDEILFNYRLRETNEQKRQRSRITKTRTKHLCKQIENIFDKLQTIDKSQINYSQNVSDETKTIISDLKIEKLAYQYVKYANFIDPNSIIVFGIGDDNLSFQVVNCENIYEKYTIKSEDGFVKYEDNKTTFFGKDLRIISEYETKIRHAFELGFIKDISTSYQTNVGLLDPASELFVSLIWDGSELDIIKALHGIVRTYAYADQCNHSTIIDGNTDRCEDGLMSLSKRKCPNCTGGLKIPTSSQDVQYFRRPNIGEPTEELSKMVYHEVINPSILDIRKQDIEQLEDKIIRTIFNSNFVTQKDITLTATEKKIDNEGVISALGTLGKQVSECIVWMCNCIAQHVGDNDAQFFHGYSLDFTLDNIDSLVYQRKLAIEANVPKSIIDSIDYAIQKKQHIDNPSYLDQLHVWEKFKPFSDKTNEERLALLAMLRPDNEDRLLYIYFQRIKNDILEELESRFYDLNYNQQKTLIYNAVSNFKQNI